MKVLGLSPLDKDSTVTIVDDGVITYAAAEERFTRVKLQSGFPWQSLEDALDRTGTKATEIDKVVYPFLPYDEETRLFERNLQRERELLEGTEAAATSDEIQRAKSRIPGRREAVLARGPSEKQEKDCSRHLRRARKRGSFHETSPSAAPSVGP